MGLLSRPKKANGLSVQNRSNTYRTAPKVIPIKKRLKKMKPNTTGLYPHEILLLSYAPDYYTKTNKFPPFWWYRYGIKDVDKLLKSLRKKGFLKIGSL
ncbi:hypothetical protein [Alkalibacterium kapii]|uniref:Uncharacterized protein n=1 Tax=Alkalibacterium kapii TaxID=426704 RepID=A0A511AWX7_9LACT|nr:hypothetical protein [Alkalibacterium kapii]GEK92142.1 hypothetical protein AKA01nite_17640 [Alkalibacterium kapii]